MGAGEPRPWRVVRFDMPIDRAFDERLRREADIELVVSAMATSDADVARALGGAHVYHVSSTRNEMARFTFVTAGLLERCPELICISTFGAGYDSVDVDACTKAGVAVMCQAGANKDSVAEHTFALILSVVHRIGESDRRLRAQRGFTREALMGHEIHGLTLGIVGIGHVGTRVAGIAKAFGLEVIATDPLLDPQEIARRGARAVSFDELIEKADIVSLHCPRDETTIGMFRAPQFARMKAGSVFVTTARGGIHDEAALADAVRSGHLYGAGVDVWEPEPPPLEHPLLALPNVVATFHTAGVTHEARRNIALLASEQVVDTVRGAKPPRLVNPVVWPAYRQRYEDAAASLSRGAGTRTAAG